MSFLVASECVWHVGPLPLIACRHAASCYLGLHPRRSPRAPESRRKAKPSKGPRVQRSISSCCCLFWRGRTPKYLWTLTCDKDIKTSIVNSCPYPLNRVLLQNCKNAIDLESHGCSTPKSASTFHLPPLNWCLDLIEISPTCNPPSPHPPPSNRATATHIGRSMPWPRLLRS